ncbi:hypothetical protein KGF54_005110 [Candida jiufengensis]|uniref:uncharacterized protein n=1 Tax=Candida jiufengensis TaxID=497108 RepID=UPI00222524F8|nr:uncharacterized protein KGF54_005110 [Candida jiufengensis]KAI5952035.1 hypothetical protein KGF54_005110 [Candida jiufengensis]
MSDTTNNSNNQTRNPIAQSTTTTTSSGESTQQVMSQLTQGLGGNYNIFSGLVIPNELKLQSKVNFMLWKNNLKRLAEGVSPEFKAFVDDEVASDSYPAIHNNKLDILLSLTVKESIISPIRSLGFIGKDIYLEILKDFGVFHTHDKIKIVVKYWEKLADPTVNLKTKFITEKEYLQFVNTLPKEEQEALFHFIWLHLSKSRCIDKYLDGYDPKLNTSDIKRFITVHPELDEGTTAINVNAVSSNVSDVIVNPANVGNLFKVQCTNCFGLGHLARNCVSPNRRFVSIPDVERRLLAFKYRFGAKTGRFNADYNNSNGAACCNFVL